VHKYAPLLFTRSGCKQTDIVQPDCAGGLLVEDVQVNPLVVLGSGDLHHPLAPVAPVPAAVLVPPTQI